MIFQCGRCGYSSKYKHHMNAHLNRKRLCVCTISQIQPHLTIKNDDEINKTMDENSPFFMINGNCMDKISPKMCESVQETNALYPEKDRIGPFETGKNRICTKCNKKYSRLDRHEKVCRGPKEDRYKCPYCGLKSRQSSHLQRHLVTCRVKKAQVHSISEVRKLREEIENLRAQMKESIVNNAGTHVTNNVTNNTNNVTIVLNCFGKENLNHITPQYLRKLINGPFTSTSEIIKQIHFDENHPENANIKIPNKKLPWAEVFSDDRWMMKKKREVLAGMVDNGFNIIDEAYHSIDPSEISVFQKRIYDAYQNEYKSKESFRKRLVQDAELVVLNQ